MRAQPRRRRARRVYLAPKIALPTRTCVAPSSMRDLEIGAHAHRQNARSRCARRSCSAARNAATACSSTGGMHIRPEIVELEIVAAEGDERVGLLRQNAGLLRLGAGIDLHIKLCGALCRFRRIRAFTIFLGQRHRDLLAVDALDHVEELRPPRAPCSTATGRGDAVRCPASRPAAPAICPWPPARGFRRRPAGPRRSPAGSRRPRRSWRRRRA